MAIDAATDRLSVAADRSDGAVRELVVDGARHHAAALPGLLAQLFEELGAAPADLAAVAVSDGPGGFTGLRVAGATAKALALGTGVPLYAAPSLLVRAAGIAADGEAVLAVSNALRGEVYAGAWRVDRIRGIETRFRPRAVSVAQLADLPPVSCVVGECPEPIYAALTHRYGRPPVPAWPRAAVLLGLIGVRGGAVPVAEPAHWEPDYGRPAEAQVQWERRHGRTLPDPDRHTG